MPKQKKAQKIVDLAEKLSILREQKAMLDAEAREFAGKRDKLNEEFKSLQAEILELRKARDQINMEVKELKQQKSNIKAERVKKTGELKNLKQQIEELAKKKPAKSFKIIQREIEGLEWRIQTTSLNLQEEKQLVDKVKQLENQLSVHRKIEQLGQKRLELETEIKALQTRAMLCSEKISEKADKSRVFHDKMLKKIEDAEKIKTEADSFHKLFLQAKEKAKPLQAEIANILGEVRRLKEEILAEEKERREKIEETLLEDIERRAREKVKRGEKLTWEEFKAFAQKGIA